MLVRYSLVLKLCLFVLTIFGCTYSEAQVHAGFSASTISGCTPITVVFKDISTGGATSWKWDLGNGTVSELQNPSVTYFTPGTYTVKLVSSNSNSSDTVMKTNYIAVFANPSAAFNVTPLIGCYPLNVSFFDQSSVAAGTITNWQWDFGDGNISNLQTPSHVYQNSGFYNVTLTVKNNTGCSTTLTKPNLISIYEGVHANFINSSPPSCGVPVTVNFINQSTGSVASYNWDFGDGQISNVSNPSHTYTSIGVYTVTLKVGNGNSCSDVIVKQSQIFVGKPKADFSIPATICSGVSFGITNNSLPTIGLQHSNWTFSDGTSDTVSNPQKAFNAAGNYTVKLNVDYGGCGDTLTKPITVLDNPIPSFKANVTASCSPPFTVAFTNNSAGTTVQGWDFGDGNTSNAANPTHTYSQFGNYTVKLSVLNANGCVGTATIPSFIHVGLPKIIKIKGAPNNGCVPYTANFNAVLDTVLPGMTYSWNFGDGTTSTLSSPSHVYANEGSYDIRLIVTTSSGCSDTLNLPKAILVGLKPHAAFVADPLIVCPSQVVNFTDLTTGGATSFFWVLGDGGTSTMENPAYTYGDTGYKNVTLIATRSGCSDTASIPNYVYIKPPISNFKDSVLCNNQFKHYFIDKSIGAVTYKWDFGDGSSSSSLHSPSHLYADTGRYSVTLLVSDSNCHHAKIIPIYILNQHANFTNFDSIGCGSTVKQFSATSNPAYIASYKWSFGDGNTISDTLSPQISHRYDLSGSYNVALKITDLNHCPDSISKPVTVKKYAPKANFSVTKNVCVNSAVVFIDSSQVNLSNKIKQWIWDFGDGTGSKMFTSAPFKHTYLQKGLYNITLIIIDSVGCTDTLVQQNAVQVNAPIADFIAQDTVKCINTAFQFLDNSTGNIISYLWNFADGNISTQKNPEHAFVSSGLFNIKLTVIDNAGCTDTVSKKNYIHISNSKALFSLSDSFTYCPPLLVSFSNKSIDLLQSNWDFGDGNTSTVLNPLHTYTSSGIFNARLSVAGVGGCVDTLVKQIKIEGPLGKFTYDPISGCAPLHINFSGSAINTDTYTWDFDDGNTIIGKDSIIEHSYKLIGSYLPKIILQNATGCKIPIYGTDSIKVYAVKAHIKQLVKSLICDSALVYFIDSAITNDGIRSYVWSFGDGQTSTLQNPVHQYGTSGIYQVNYHMVTNAGCVSDDTLKVPVKVVPSPQIAAFGPGSVCRLVEVQFSGQWLNQDTSTINWKWDFGNEQTSYLPTPLLQKYTKAGTYTIVAVATNGSGCSDTATQILHVSPTPIINILPYKDVCLGKSDSLIVSGANTYVWEINASLSCTSCANPIVTPTNTAYYKVTGTDALGCKSSDSILIKVKKPFQMTQSAGDTICAGQSVQLMASGAESYIWSPSANLSSGIVKNPVATPDVSINYRVIGYDTVGCFQDTGYVFIKVYPIPKINILENVMTLSAGASVQLHTSVSADVTRLHWSPPIGLSCVSCAEPIASPKEKTTYTLTAANEGSCTAEDKVDLLVICGDANVYVPNTFSPNGDGVNDVFYPRGKGIFKIRGMRIFSRWGQLVFEKNNFMANDENSAWNGSFNGKPLTPDVFVFIVDVVCEDNEMFTMKGNVTLLR